MFNRRRNIYFNGSSDASETVILLAFIGAIVALIGLAISNHIYIEKHHCQKTGQKEIERFDPQTGTVFFKYEYKCDNGIDWF
jgi:hypothetical protein